MPTRNIDGVEIFASGTWHAGMGGTIKYSDTDLVEIAENNAALADKLRPPLKLGHNDDQPLLADLLGMGAWDGQPAIGVAVNIRAQGDKLLADFKDVPEPIYQAIENGLYRQISIELEHIEHTGWIVTGVALLGADLPAVQTLKDLQAYLSAQHPDKGGDPAGQRLSFSLGKPNIKGESPMPDKDDKTPPDQGAELERLRVQLAAEKTRADGAEKATRKVAFDAAKSKAMASFEEKVKAGRMQPVLREKIAAAFDRQAETFDAASGLSLPADLANEIAASAALPSGEHGQDGPRNEGETADSEFVKATRDAMAKNGWDYGKASDHVKASQPQLAAAYIQNFVLPFQRGVTLN